MSALDGRRSMNGSRKTARNLLSVAALTTVMLLVMQVPAGATALGPVVDLQGQGLSITEGGVGLEDLGTGTENVTVSIGGPVQKAILVWAGREFTCPVGGCFAGAGPFGDQQLIFDGTSITGTVLGIEAEIGSNIGYSFDVTSIVQAAGTGVQSFSIQDGNTSNNLDRLDGAGLIVVFTNPSDTGVYRVLIAGGLDFAFAGTSPVLPNQPENSVTTPVSFGYAASTSSRTAQLALFVGDGEPGRPDSVKIDGVQVPSFANIFDASDGDTWDTETVSVSIAAGSTSTSVQVVSGGSQGNPDSLLWTLAALRLPIPGALAGCTPGFWKNHTSAWAGTGFSPSQETSSVFSIPGGLSSLGSKTLLQSLDGGGGSGVLGAAKILLRAGVAALLNAAHSGVNYPLTTSEVISSVNSALASNNRTTILTLATTLDSNNNLGCSL